MQGKRIKYFQVYRWDPDQSSRPTIATYPVSFAVFLRACCSWSCLSMDETHQLFLPVSLNVDVCALFSSGRCRLINLAGCTRACTHVCACLALWFFRIFRFLNVFAMRNRSTCRSVVLWFWTPFSRLVGLSLLKCNFVGGWLCMTNGSTACTYVSLACIRIRKKIICVFGFDLVCV